MAEYDFICWKPEMGEPETAVKAGIVLEAEVLLHFGEVHPVLLGASKVALHRHFQRLSFGS